MTGVRCYSPCFLSDGNVNKGWLKVGRAVILEHLDALFLLSNNLIRKTKEAVWASEASSHTLNK